MWKYIVFDKNGKVHIDYFEDDLNMKASQICALLESSGFEVLELKKVNTVSLNAALYKMISKWKPQIAVCH